MKKLTVSLLALLWAGLGLLAAEPETSLPGSDLTIEKAVSPQVSEAKWKFGFAAVCEATEKAEVMIGNMTDHAMQKFKVVQALGGAVPEGEVTLSYNIIAPNEREIAKGRRVIWIVQEREGNSYPYKALPDTDQNRQAVLAALKAARIQLASQPTSRSSSQPTSRSASRPTRDPA